VYKLLADIGYM